MLQHFSDPLLSVWQSAVLQVAKQTAQNELLNATSVVTQAVAKHLENNQSNLSNEAAVAKASDAVLGTSDSPLPPAAIAKAAATPSAAALPAADGHVSCAAAAFQLAVATARNDQATVAKLQPRFGKFRECDAGWLKCVAEFSAKYAVGGQSNIPYRKWTSQDDYVLNDVLTDQITIAIAGDWGTGEPPALAVMDQIVARKPDLFIHLGDIYYSGTAEETVDHFFDIVRKKFGKRSFTLAGNHDMYSGGKPYYDLLTWIEQPASFFCLRNANWQILAMDTGYNDFNPLNVKSAVTSLRDEKDYSELAWHLDKFANNGNRRTIVLSHHQLFSAAGLIGGYAINQKLLGQLKGVIPQIDLWLWGHEHSHIIFDSYTRLDWGRCIGASAIVVPSTENPYATDSRIKDGPPTFNKDHVLTVNAQGNYNQGYATLTLNGRSATLDHYEVTQNSSRLFHPDTI